MTLTRDSVLHYWSSRYGINPRVGGRPVFTRNSAGLFTTQEGEVDTAIVNTPRFDWATVSGERRKGLTLELARTNSVLWSRDLSNAAWTKTSATAALNALGLDGTPSSASTLTDASAGAHGTADQSVTIANNNATHNSVYWIRKDTITARFVGLESVLSGGTIVFRTVHLNTSTGAVTISNSAGTGSVGVTSIGDWWRVEISLTNNTTGNTSVVARVYAAIGSVFGVSDVATQGSCVVGHVQAELNVSFGSAPIFTTTAAATRATDSCYWNFPPVPQAMMVYVRFVERGSILTGGVRVFQISSAADATPQAIIYNSGTYYTIYHHSGAGSVTQALAVAPAIGNTVELVGMFFADGSVELIQSVDGAAVTYTAQSGALAYAAAWSDKRLYVNSVGAASVGSNQFAEVKFVKYADVVASTAQGIMDELRAFELGPNGDAL